jgi:hypothetical protein
MLTGVIHRTGVAPALLSDPLSRQPLARDRYAGARARHPLSSPSPMRFRPIGLLLSGVVVASSACSMDATAPAPLAPSPSAARATESWGGSGWNDRASRSRSANAPETTSAYAVTVDPQRHNVLRFGPYTLDLPANAICNRGSGYGLDLFDAECKAEKRPVTISALVRFPADGLPRIDLLPEVRFSPERVVTLTLSVADAPMPASSPRFLYCATLSTLECVDEALLDPTLATYLDEANGTVFRRIKHFSGYFVEW